MPSMEIIDLRQSALLWAFVGYDADGQPVLAYPVQIPVRWINTRVVKQDPLGNTVGLDGPVIVKQDVAVGSAMWLGTLSRWSSIGYAQADNEVCEVKAFHKTPDIKDRFFRRKCEVMRRKGIVSTAMALSVTTPSLAIQGVSFGFTVQALNLLGQVDVNYAGIVEFTSSDPSAVLPSPTTLINGQGTFLAILETLGSQTISATDSVVAALTGISGVIDVIASGGYSPAYQFSDSRNSQYIPLLL